MMHDADEQEAFGRRFPDQVGRISTHYEGCYRSHPGCAYHLGFSDGRSAATQEELPPHRECLPDCWSDCSPSIAPDKQRCTRDDLLPRGPFDIEAYRLEIEEFKRRRMANPWKKHAYEVITQEQCIQAWIEQIADAELYEQRWHEWEDAK